MALATLNGGRGILDLIRWPHTVWREVNSSNLSMSLAAQHWAISLIAPKTGNLAKIHFWSNSVITGGDVHVSFQNVDTVGKPDGVVDQFRLITMLGTDDSIWKSSGLITSDGTDIGTKRVVTAGDKLSVVFKWNNFINESMNFGSLLDSNIVAITYLFSSTDGGSTWGGQNSRMLFALEYDDGSIAYLQDSLPLKGSSAILNLTETSTPDEVCLRFRVPFPVRATGVAVFGEGVDTILSLYPDSGAALAQGSPEVASLTPTFRHEYHFTSPVDLLANTWYRIGFKPTNGATTTIRRWDMAASNYREAFDLGLNFMHGTRVDSGAWTDSETSMMVATLLVSGLDDGTAGGGGTCNFGALPNGMRVIPVAQ